MTEHRLLDLAVLARQVLDRAHSAFSPSASSMWLACSGSLIPNLLAPDDAGPDAAYGTVAHTVTETWLDQGRPPKFMLGNVIKIGPHEIEIDEEMFDYAEQCVDRSEWVPGDQFIERKVYFSHLTPIPQQGGTMDVGTFRKGLGVLDDHKFGSSPENIVYAEENSQLMLYAIGADAEWGKKYGFKDFILRINQPRLKHFDEWHVSRSRLMEFGEYVRERAKIAWSLDAPRVPGPKQCRFCAVRASCAALAKFNVDLTAEAFVDETQTVDSMKAFVDRFDDDLEPFRLHFAKFAELTIEQKAALLQFRSMAESWWKALAADVDRIGKTGIKIPGYKYVEGRSRRHWKNVEDAKTALTDLGLDEDDFVEEVLMSPKQVEPLLRKKGYKLKDIPALLQSVVHKPPGRPTLVRITDKRPEVGDLSALVFEDESATRETEEDI